VGVSLAGLLRLLVPARLVRGDLLRVRDTAPLAAELAAELPDKSHDRRLELSVDPDGALLDTASPRLAAARRDVQAARQRLLRKLDALLRGLDGAATPANASVTVRNGRYVIPVRRDSRSRPTGIVHDESGGGGTLFVEPSEAVELGNALREAQAEEEQEALRVMRELTDLLRPELPRLRAALEMAVAVDDLVARARYAVATEAEVPAVARAPAPLRIVRGRHPLLLAAGGDVVPFDLTLAADERTLLVSGPNTGGKTVLLKATALAAALAGSGIVPPVGPETALPVFRRFFADIGDRQSIAASLSTFSAHVATLRRILEEADDASLVLLDEVGGGTDPAEGAALAAAALVALTRRGSITLATTHLGTLKNLATHEPGVVNASLQFDAATLTPTYRFTKGVPGRSYGLAIARRLGVPSDILADAEARVSDAERSLDALLAAAEERDRALRAAQTAADARAIELDGMAARLTMQHESQAAREKELARREKEAERRAREAVDEAAAREARRKVEEGIRAQGEALAAAGHEGGEGERDAGADGAVEPGQRVRLATGATGNVLERRSDGKLVVAVGSMRMVVEPKTVTPLSNRGARREAVAPAAPALDARPPETSYEVDLRGLTGDEAEAAALAALDAAVLAEQPYLRIIHGMGTGVVRERVRRIVARDRRVAKYDFAPRNQGGTGVTIVEFGG
jgi:DNA mismatch repair protein MutS2